MGVDIIHQDHQTGAGDLRSGLQLLLRSHTVKPDPGIPGLNLAVNDTPRPVTKDAPCAKAKCVDQKIMRRLDVLADQQWNRL